MKTLKTVTPALKERRHEPRTATRMPANVLRQDRWGFPIQRRMGRTLDLSHNGASLELDRRPALNERVKVTLALGPQTLEVAGRVRSVQELEDGSFRIGLQFIDLDYQTYDRLHGYLHAQERMRRGGGRFRGSRRAR